MVECAHGKAGYPSPLAGERSGPESAGRDACRVVRRARGDARPDSDIDIMVELAPDAHLGVWGYVAIIHTIEDLFPLPVDVSDRAAQKPHVRPSAEREAIYAF